MSSWSVIRITWAIVVACLLGALSGYQALGISRDYYNYLQFFDLVRVAPDFESVSYRFEPGFTALVFALVRTGWDNALIYSLIAGAAVLLKCYAIPYSRRYPIVVLVFLFYLLTRYLALFEMTVLRATCAFALAFLVFVRRDNTEYRIRDLILLSAAALFHYSAVIFILIYLVRRVTRVRIIVISIAAFVAIFASKGFVLSYLQGYVNSLSAYGETTKATTFPVLFVLDLLLLVFIFGSWKSCDLVMRYCALGLALSASFHFALLDGSVFAARFRELLSVFVLIYIVRALISRSPITRYAAIAFAAGTGVLHVYVTYFYDPLLL